ncbi:MAG: galactose-1-epimerase [Flavobacteriia bacterium]|nr:MAG: galactose-1-epimerase [Flavobacteriia bacterium]
MEKADFIAELNGKPIRLYKLSNKNGVTVEITNFGGKIVTIIVPDKEGNFKDVVLGFDTIDEYIKGNPYFGALIGRSANRIRNGRFVLEGKEYQLSQNIGENHLHGGVKGFNDVVWDADFNDKDQILELSYLSKDGEEGYPGNLKVKATFSLTDENELEISYHAETDKTSIVNLTHHSFFNLRGEGNGDVLDHQVMINADAFTPVSDDVIPTGEIRDVTNTPMDLRKLTPLKKDINSDYEQIQKGSGFDHNWVINKDDGVMALAAAAYEPESGRYMEVWTDQPGVQLYAGNFLDGSDIGKGGKAYERRTAFCFETQHFPDSPNHENFPSTVLKPGEVYNYTCTYKFSTKES